MADGPYAHERTIPQAEAPVSTSGPEERPAWPRFRSWSEMSRWRRYLVAAMGALVLIIGGVGAGVEIHQTGRVWPTVRYVLLSLPVAAALFLVIGFYKTRRVGPTLLSLAGLAALLAAIWWAVPAGRGLVLSVGEMVTALGAGVLVFTPAVYGRIPAALGAAAGLLGLLHGISWAFPVLPEPARIFVDAGVEGVLWLGLPGFVLHAAERVGLLTLPWDDPRDADATQASKG